MNRLMSNFGQGALKEKFTAPSHSACRKAGSPSVNSGWCRPERDVQVYPAATTAKMFSAKRRHYIQGRKISITRRSNAPRGRRIYVNRKRESAGRELRHCESANVTCHRPHPQTERIPHEKSVMTARSLATTLRLGEPGRHPPVKHVTAACGRELKQKQDTRKSVLFRSGSET